MYKMESGRWAVVGIVSWGTVYYSSDQSDTISGYLMAVKISLGIDGKCAVAGQPGVYTRVSAFSDWIYRKISSA